MNLGFLGKLLHGAENFVKKNDLIGAGDPFVAATGAGTGSGVTYPVDPMVAEPGGWSAQSPSAPRSKESILAGIVSDPGVRDVVAGHPAGFLEGFLGPKAPPPPPQWAYHPGMGLTWDTAANRKTDQNTGLDVWGSEPNAIGSDKYNAFKGNRF
jgi:hypothetical protein